MIDDMIADINTNKKFQAIVKDLLFRCRKLNISLVFITQSYFFVPKEVRVNSANSASFKYKSSIIEKTPNNGNYNNIKNVKIVVPLKYLSNFWRTLDMPLINCEINLILIWSENCVLTNMITRTADPNANPAVEAMNAPESTTFKIENTKLYVPVVT